jgi:predicted nucleotidyltransferase
MRRPKVVKRIADLLHRIVPDASVILYGSEARGDARKDSDIDFLVLLDSEGDSFRQQEWMITEQLMILEAESGVSLSPYIVPKQWWNRKSPTPFSINVKNEGVLI